MNALRFGKCPLQQTLNEDCIDFELGWFTFVLFHKYIHEALNEYELGNPTPNDQRSSNRRNS